MNFNGNFSEFKSQAGIILIKKKVKPYHNMYSNGFLACGQNTLGQLLVAQHGISHNNGSNIQLKATKYFKFQTNNTKIVSKVRVEWTKEHLHISTECSEMCVAFIGIKLYQFVELLWNMISIYIYLPHICIIMNVVADDRATQTHTHTHKANNFHLN